MQVYKTIKEVPTEILTESLLAIQDLRRKYLGQEQITEYAGCIDETVDCTKRCSLCKFDLLHNEYKAKGETDCICPWFWMEGTECCSSKLPKMYFDESIPERLMRADRWEDATVEELALRRIGGHAA